MKIPGIRINNTYELKEKLYEDGFINTFLGEDVQQNRKVRITILKKESVSHRTEDIIRFHNDLNILIKCDHPFVEKIDEFIEQDGMHYIVGPAHTMENLYTLLCRNFSFDQSFSVKIILHCAEALEYTHRMGIMHRDVNPKHIFLSFEEKETRDNIQVLLSHFAFSRIKELERIIDPREIENTFSYMSPEECGVIKKNINESSDLYSLGILFYYLLTGVLPFKGTTINSIIHKHIAQLPLPPSRLNSQCPEILDMIVMKLLEKEQENRYHSARGLILDLRRFMNGNHSFHPGMDDTVTQLRFKSKLVGRDRELSVLQQVLTTTIHKHGNICLVQGMSGTGKTRLIEELRNYAYAKSIPFITGKSFPGENKPPYGPIKEALQTYLLFYHSYPEDKKKKIQNKLKIEIGYLGQILTSIVPEYKEIIGKSPQLINLDNVKERRRFLITLSRFFCFLANAEGGLILCLEDLQWADEGSLDVLQEMIESIKTSSIMLIGTYRGNEVHEDHRINLLFKEVEKYKNVCTHINIRHFDKPGITDFVSSLLNNSVRDIDQIAHFIFTKSAGNPLFAMEVLKKLVSEKIIFYKNDMWNIDNEHLHKIKIPTEVINILLNRILLLNEHELDILTHAATVGNVFSLDILFELCDYDKHIIVDIIDRAVGLQLIEYDVYNRDRISFTHSRIQEAFYSRLPVSMRKQYHLRIAQTIESLHERISDHVLFALAYHYIESGDREKILTYAYPAGEAAKKSFAHDEAIKYFQKVVEVLNKKQYADSDLWLSAMQHIAEISIIIGQNKKGIDILGAVLQRQNNPVKKAKIYHQISLACYKSGEYARCESFGALGLDMLGEKIPVHKYSIIFNLFWELLVRVFYTLFPFSYKEERESGKSEVDKIIIQIHFTLSWSYVVTDLLKFMRTTLRFLNFSERHFGISPELTKGLCGYASLLMTIPLFSRANKIHIKAFTMREQMEDILGIAESHQLMGYCFTWQGNYEKGIIHFEKSMRLFKIIGDIKEYTIALIGNGECCLFLARYKESEVMVRKYMQFVEKIKDYYAIANSRYYLASIYYEQGDLEKAKEYALTGYEVCQRYNLGLIHCMLLLRLGSIFLEQRKPDEALYYLEKAKELIIKKRYINHYISFLYTLFAMVYSYKYTLVNDDRQEKKKLLLKIKISSKQAVKKTKHWPAHRSGALRVRAHYYALVGKRRKAKKFYRMSIDHAVKHLQVGEKGKSYLEYGAFLARGSDRKSAQKYIETAYQIFSETGAQHYKNYAAEMLGVQNTDDEYSPQSRFIEKQRYATIIDVSRDIGSVYNLKKLIGKILTKAVEITGAQRGCLFIKNHSTDELEIKSTNNLTESEVTQSIVELAAYVYESRNGIILEKHDPEIMNNKNAGLITGSIMCVPLQSKEEMVGVCYLDNLLTRGVFSQEDLQVLEVIMTHAAISIENTMLNKNIKDYTMKIMEIEKQLFQVDRLSTLGTSLSEVLHEINNFNMVIKNNTTLLQKQFKYLFPILEKYYSEQGDFRMGRIYYNDFRNNYAQLYERILRNSENIQNLVHVMKNFSRLDNMQRDKVDIHQVITEALDICLIKAKKRSVEILYKKEKELPFIYGHKQYLTQVVINIINNSIEAVEKESSFVKIKTDYDLKLKEILVQIEDNGGGIEHAHLQRITEPFFTTKDSKGGTGLGLSLVFKIIQSHNGRISFQSEKNKGTIVTINLPSFSE